MPAKKQPVTKSSSKKNLAKKPHDALDAKVKLEGKLEENGISVTARSRTIAALDRLVGGLIGWVAEYPEGKRREVQARAEGREVLIRAQDAVALRRLEQDDELGRVRLQKFLRDEYRKQDNHFAVASYALEDLLTASPSLPAPSDAAQASSSDDPPTLDDDWMNLFSDYAARASSDRFREQWGRILAGEIRKPGSFSSTTLRVMVEMDAQLARSFQDVYRLSIGGYALRPMILEGEEFDKFAHLQAAGLTQTDVTWSRDIGPNPDGYGYLLAENHLLRVTFRPGQSKVSFPPILITRAGREIGSFLPRDELEGLRQIGLSLTAAQKVELCVIVSRQGHSIRWECLEVLYEQA